MFSLFGLLIVSLWLLLVAISGIFIGKYGIEYFAVSLIPGGLFPLFGKGIIG
jgi:hypothetical protein